MERVNPNNEPDAYAKSWLQLLQLDKRLDMAKKEGFVFTSVYRLAETLANVERMKLKPVKLVVFDDLLYPQEVFFKPIAGLSIILVRPSDYLQEVKSWPLDEALAWSARRILQEIPGLMVA